MINLLVDICTIIILILSSISEWLWEYELFFVSYCILLFFYLFCDHHQHSHTNVQLINPNEIMASTM